MGPPYGCFWNPPEQFPYDQLEALCRGLSSDTAHTSIIAQSLGRQAAVIVLIVLATRRSMRRRPSLIDPLLTVTNGSFPSDQQVTTAERECRLS
jgi:hypothetical protein